MVQASKCDSALPSAFDVRLIYSDLGHDVQFTAPLPLTVLSSPALAHCVSEARNWLRNSRSTYTGGFLAFGPGDGRKEACSRTRPVILGCRLNYT